MAGLNQITWVRRSGTANHQRLDRLLPEFEVLELPIIGYYQHNFSISLTLFLFFPPRKKNFLLQYATCNCGRVSISGQNDCNEFLADLRVGIGSKVSR